MATARRHAPSHLLLAALLPRRSGRLPRAPRTSLPLSLTLPRPHPLPWTPLSRHRTRPSPPFAVAATTAVPTMPRAAPELLHLVANPLTEPRDRKSPEAPPRRFFPSSATEDRRRQIRRHPAFLKLAVHLYRVYVSSSSISPPPRARSRTLAALFTGAVSSSPPAMTRTRPEPPELATEHGNVLHTSPGT